MSKKHVSTIVSGGGMFLNIMSDLVQEVERQGGSDLHLHRLSTPNGRETIEKMAALIVAQRIEESYTLTIPYDIPLATLINQIPGIKMAGDPNIPFWPVETQPPCSETLSVNDMTEAFSDEHHCGQAATQRAVKEALIRRGLNPASLHAFIAFVRANVKRIIGSVYIYGTFVDLTDHRNKHYSLVTVARYGYDVLMSFSNDTVLMDRRSRIVTASTAS